MSRSGYSDECYGAALALWRSNIRRATAGKRGQAFFHDLVAALDAMPVKRLVANELETTDGEVCTLGALNKQRAGDAGILGAAINAEDYGALGEAFDIPGMLAQEVMYMNDEAGPVVWRRSQRIEETPEERWARIRAWAAEQVRAGLIP